MEFKEINVNDFSVFHELMNDYYREGEDEGTEQEVIESVSRILFGAFITAVMLLIFEVIRKCVAFAKAKGLKLYEKIKERKGANEADKKAE